MSITEIWNNWTKGNVSIKNLQCWSQEPPHQAQHLRVVVSPEEFQKKVDQEKEDDRTGLTENEESDSKEDVDEDLPDI